MATHRNSLPNPQNLWILSYMVRDVIKLKILKGVYSESSSCTLNTVTCILLRRRQRKFWKRRGGSNVTTEAQNLVQPQAKEYPQLPRTGRGKEWILPWSLWRRPTLPTPGFQTSGFQKYKRINFCVLNHPVCGNLLEQPSEPNIKAETAV